jgi:hypothetical protein
MTDHEFLDTIYRYGEALKGRPLTPTERQRILEEFNQATGDAHARAKLAVRKVLGAGSLYEEMRKSANLDNTQRLLADLERAAAQWQASKK